MNEKYKSLITAEIDDYLFLLEENTTLFQACLEKGINVPRFCYHISLGIAGNCRICSVEEKKSEKVVLSCSTIIDGETEIFTFTFLVMQSRENVSEYLLCNHPLDCPICDQAGECDLQDQVTFFGADVGRFNEVLKKTVENKNLNPLIKFSLNKCIYCGRCSRFFLEVSDSSFFTLLGRGIDSEIGNYKNIAEKTIIDELSGNVLDLCPVGALTSKPYSFVGRVWEYVDINYVDIFDDFLSNIRVDFQGTTIVRILPDANFLVNDEWISDKTRFSYDSYSRQRLTKPFFVFFNKYFYFSWMNSLFFLKKYFFLLLNFYILKKKNNYNFKFGFDRFNDIFSTFLLKNFSYFFGLNFFYFLQNLNFKESDFRTSYICNFKLFDFEKAICENEEISSDNNIKNYNIILMNLNLRYESPIYNTKFKRILKNNSNFSVFNFGFQNYNNFFSLGFNYFFFFKNLFYLIEFFYFSMNIIFLLGTFFFYYNKILGLLNIFKFFFFKIFKFLVFFNYLTYLSNRVITYELNALNNKNFYKLNFYSELSPGILFNLDLNFIDFNLMQLKNNLLIYQGHHNNSFIKYSNLILPISTFVERPDLLINTEGYIKIFFYTYFKYKLDSIKNSWAVISIFFKFLKAKIEYNFRDIKIHLNEISPIFFNRNNDKFLKFWNFLFFDFKFFNLNAMLFPNYYNNFFYYDSISKASVIMSLCSKKYTVINDFKYAHSIGWLFV